MIFPPSLQLSVAVASPVAAGVWSASQLTVMSAAQLITGATSSITVMICSQVDSLPHSSTAVHTLRIVPALPPQSVNTPPSLSSNEIVIFVTSLQLSVAVISPVALGVLSSSQLIVISATHAITGAVSSITVIICSHVASLPQASTAVHVLTITPALPPHSVAVRPS